MLKIVSLHKDKIYLMNILLIGEYSRLHNSLKEGLVKCQHKVTLVGNGDCFKGYPNDYSIDAKFVKYGFMSFVNKVLVKFNIVNIEKIETALRFFFFIIKQKKFDHIQFINSDCIRTYPFLSRILYKFTFEKSKSRSLLVCGDEYPIVNFQLTEKNFYSVHTPYLENKKLKKLYTFSLKYLKNGYVRTFKFLEKNCHSIITSDLDYEIPMCKMHYKTHFIPNPINIDKVLYLNNENNDKVIIFLGINNLNRVKKGIVFFEKALELIRKNFRDRVEIIITENIPYNQYIRLYDRAHIILDQVYAYDQGYNALEAMAKGKVVFTGAEKEWLEHYEVEENSIVINALPNVESIYRNLEILINNPEKLNEIGKNARNFIEKHHHYIDVSKQYISVWEKNLEN